MGTKLVGLKARSVVLVVVLFFAAACTPRCKPGGDAGSPVGEDYDRLLGQADAIIADTEKASLVGDYLSPDSLYSRISFAHSNSVSVHTSLLVAECKYFVIGKRVVIRHDQGFFDLDILDKNRLEGVSPSIQGEIFTRNTEPDDRPALRLTKQEIGDLERLIYAYVGIKYYTRNKRSRGLAIWETGVNKGSPDSAYLLGIHHLNRSIGVPAEKKKAREYFSMAARLGLNVAYFKLGELEEEDGNDEAASGYFRKACDLKYKAGCLSAEFLEDK